MCGGPLRSDSFQPIIQGPGVSVLISVPSEAALGERRVALVPESCKKLIQAGYAVAIESGAGREAYLPDDAYRDVGVAVESDPAALLNQADIVVRVNAPPLAGASGA